MRTYLHPTDNIILRAARILQQGGLVAFPTETVYGLGADAFNTQAVARIFEVKQRPRFDPLIIHIPRVEDLDSVAQSCELAWRLADVFWPGPLTLVLPKRDHVPDIVTAGLPTVAVRVPDNTIAIRLIELCGRPVAAPSANCFGCMSPTSVEHVERHLGYVIDMILDGGPCRVGVESTILSITDEDGPRLLRPGGVAVEAIQKIIGPVNSSKSTNTFVTAPGMLPRHYAPRTTIRLLDPANTAPMETGKRIGLLAFTHPMRTYGYQAIEVLSKSGDLAEAAANLFDALHRLDAAGLDLIVCESLPEFGLGVAVMDRLRRAAHTGYGGPPSSSEVEELS